jgi:hypothetical protein
MEWISPTKDWKPFAIPTQTAYIPEGRNYSGSDYFKSNILVSNILI